MAYHLLIEQPSPFSTEEVHKAFLKSMEGVNHPDAHAAVATVRQQLKDRRFDPPKRTD